VHVEQWRPDDTAALRGSQWQPGDTTVVLAPQRRPGDAVAFLDAQWRPGDATSVLSPQWTAQTMASTTTAPTTSASAVSTGPPSVTDYQDREVRAAIAAQVGVTEAAYDAALRNPQNEALIGAVEAATVEGSPARSEFVSTYYAITDVGGWAAPDPVTPNSVTMVGEPYVAPDGTEAWVTVCHVSGDSLMGLDDAGEVIVVADKRNARLIVQTFRLDRGTWKLFQREQLLMIPEGTSCETSNGPSSSLPESSPP
jgi:hypothetical protein